MSAADPACRQLRVDAERNRGRILEAAQTEFAERGLDVPLEDVAVRAGVGIATLYRRFPTREDLIGACFERRLEEYERAAEEALEAPDGWTGFAGYVELICAMQAADRGLKDVLTRTFPNAKALEARRTRGFALFVQIVERAKADGSLRSDFTPEDHVLLLMGNAGVIQGMGSEAPDAWRRYLALMLDGMHTGPSRPLPPPPTPRQVVRAMLRLNPTPRSTRSPR